MVFDRISANSHRFMLGGIHLRAGNFAGGNGDRPMIDHHRPSSTRSSEPTRPGDLPAVITAQMTQDHQVGAFPEIDAYAHDLPSSNNNEHVVA